MKSLTQITSLLFALSLVACSSEKSSQTLQNNQSSDSRIVSGTSVSKDEAIAHSTVGLVIETKSGSQATCTGTLIDSNIVLTAAHCFMTEPGDEVQMVAVAFVNSFDDISATTIRGVVDAIVNPAFMPQDAGKGTWNDVALLKFQGDLPASYKPVGYLSDLSKLHVGMPAIIAGYGLTNASGNETKPEDIQMGNLLKADVKMSEIAHEGGELLSDVKENPASTCQGDSGGPAYAEIDGQLTVIGITSRGDNDRCDSVSIYTSTAFQAKFIAASIQTLKSK